MFVEFPGKGSNFVESAPMGRNEAKLPKAIVSTILLHGHQMAGISFSVQFAEEKVKFISSRVRGKD
jgi:hypothetical protein